MSNTDKLREIAEGILSDLFEAGMDAQEVGMPSFDMLKTSGYIDRKLSDLTALISEGYVSKKEHEKLAEDYQRLLEQYDRLIDYDDDCETDED